MEAMSSMEVKHGLPMLHLRKLARYTFTWIRLILGSDVFIVWAKCKWDGKIRGFILEKVQQNPFLLLDESVLTTFGREWTA